MPDTRDLFRLPPDNGGDARELLRRLAPDIEALFARHRVPRAEGGRMVETAVHDAFWRSKETTDRPARLLRSLERQCQERTWRGTGEPTDPAPPDGGGDGEESR